MVGPVPFIHFIQLGFTVMNGKNRTLGQNLKLAVRDQGGDLDNDVVLGIEAGHFQVHPDHGGVLGHGKLLSRQAAAALGDSLAKAVRGTRP